MSRWIAALGARLRDRGELLLELIALRHQVAILQRTGTCRPCFRPTDRLFWVFLSRWWVDWRRPLVIVQPATVLRWRRQGLRAIWSPAGTPDLTKFGGSIDWPYDLEGRPLYPYWPICFCVLDLAPAPENPQDSDYDERVEAFRAAQAAAVEKHLPRRKYNLSPGQAFAGPPIPDWWQNAIQLSSDLARVEPVRS